MSSQPQPHDVNPAQWQAICHTGSHVLIVAGPGTGKTHTLTYRMARRAADLNPSERILAITFTNKTANEMRERLILHPQARDQAVFGCPKIAYCETGLSSEVCRYPGKPVLARLSHPTGHMPISQRQNELRRKLRMKSIPSVYDCRSLHVIQAARGVMLGTFMKSC